jgi:hypothetical protein
MAPVLEAFRRLGWRGAGEAVGVLVFLLILAQMQASHNGKVEAQCEVERLRLAYQNPSKRAVRETVTVAGPVRIVTRTVERPGGEKETTVEETRGAVTTSDKEATTSEPVALTALLRPREDRWLLSLGASRLSLDAGGKTFLAGYGWRNRFDLQAGFSTGDRTRVEALATFRF